MMGMSRTSFYLSWAIHYGIIYTVVCILITIVLKFNFYFIYIFYFKKSTITQIIYYLSIDQLFLSNHSQY